MPTEQFLMGAAIERVMNGNRNYYLALASGVAIGAYASLQAAQQAANIFMNRTKREPPPKPKGVLDWMPED
jgi:hypothetical protein